MIFTSNFEVDKHTFSLTSRQTCACMSFKMHIIICGWKQDICNAAVCFTSESNWLSLWYASMWCRELLAGFQKHPGKHPVTSCCLGYCHIYHTSEVSQYKKCPWHSGYMYTCDSCTRTAGVSLSTDKASPAFELTSNSNRDHIYSCLKNVNSNISFSFQSH